MKRIMILGGQGNLGETLLNALAGNHVLAPKLDITNLDMLKDFFQMLMPEIVINAAAFTNVDACELDQEKAELVNGFAVDDIARLCKKYDARLVQVSSDYVFDGRKRSGYREDMGHKKPLSAYGTSKLLAENLLLQGGDEMPPTYIVRTAMVYGRKKGVVRVLARHIEEDEPLSLISDMLSSSVFVHDLADAIRDLILSQESEPGIYHIVNDGFHSVHELGMHVAQVLGKETPSIKKVSFKKYSQTRTAQRPQYSGLLNTRFPKLRNWKEAVQDCLSEK